MREPYTRCSECGLWDDHAPTCITGCRAAYVGGEIELPEFERRVGAIFCT